MMSSLLNEFSYYAWKFWSSQWIRMKQSTDDIWTIEDSNIIGTTVFLIGENVF